MVNCNLRFWKQTNYHVTVTCQKLFDPPVIMSVNPNPGSSTSTSTATAQNQKHGGKPIAKRKGDTETTTAKIITIPTIKPQEILTIPGREWEEDLKLETVAILMNYFNAVFNMIVYKRADYPRKAFCPAKMFDMDVPVCLHPQIEEYIEMSSQRLVSMMIINYSTGVELLFVDRKETIEKFVITFSGEMNLNSLFTSSEDPSSAKVVITELNEKLKNSLTTLQDKIESKPKCFKSSKILELTFNIQFGISHPCAELYKDNANGPFQDDSIEKVFPMSKPVFRAEIATSSGKSSTASGGSSSSYQKYVTPAATKMDLLETPSTSNIKSRKLNNQNESEELEIPNLEPIQTFFLFENLVANIYVLTYANSQKKPTTTGSKKSANSKKSL